MARSSWYTLYIPFSLFLLFDNNGDDTPQNFIVEFTTARQLLLYSVHNSTTIARTLSHTDISRSFSYLHCLCHYITFHLPYTSGYSKPPFPSGFPTKCCTHFRSPPFVLHAPPTSFPIQYLVMSKNREAVSQNAVLVSFIVLPPSEGRLGPSGT